MLTQIKITPIFFAKTRVQTSWYHFTSYKDVVSLYLICAVTGATVNSYFQKWNISHPFHHCCSRTMFSSFSHCPLPPYRALFKQIRYLLFLSWHLSSAHNSIILWAFCQQNIIRWEWYNVPLIRLTYCALYILHSEVYQQQFPVQFRFLLQIFECCL